MSSDLQITKLNLFTADALAVLENLAKVLLEDAPSTEIEQLENGSAISSLSSCQSDDSSAEYRCGVCSCEFKALEEQREHFQADWHTFNLRRKLKGVAPVKEEEYESIMTENESSSSSSDSDSECADDCNRNKIRQKLKESGRVYFVTNENLVFSCFRCLLVSPLSKETSSSVLTNSCKRLLNQTSWIILSLAGGHFAGVVFEKNEPVVHKTFSRYTVRAKQGGGQASHDSQQHQNKAKSAGASLRRYNELALCQDIRELLVDWRQYIRRCHLIFIRCSTYHRYIFFDGSKPAFEKSDPRIRSIPFNTHRPTFEEVRRIHKRLTTVLCYGKSDEFLAEWKEKVEPDVRKLAPKANKSNIKTAKKASSSSSSEEDLFYLGPEIRTDSQSSFTFNNGVKQQLTEEKLSELKVKEKSKRTSAQVATTVEQRNDNFSTISKETKQKIYTLCKTGDSIELHKLLSETTEDCPKNHLISYLNTPLTSAGSPTFLHLASSTGHCQLLRVLLEFGCNPCVKNGSGQVPFQVSNSKSVRKEFSRFRDDFPDRWDWNKAQVPQSVDPETEAARNARLSEKRRIEKKLKAEKLKSKKEEEAQLKLEEAERQKFLALSDREKRALAAERRILTNCTEHNVAPPVLNRCFQCALDITGKVPFEYSEFRFCSTRCLQQHRKNTDVK